MRRIALCLSALATLTVFGAACGEDKGPRLTAEEFAAQANAVCKEGDQKLADAGNNALKDATTPEKRVDFMIEYIVGSAKDKIEGIEKLKASPFNLLGRYNDDRSGSSAVGTKHVQVQHRNFGEFRVPGLRGVAQTAPYMHNGSLATLEDVVRFYSELNEERLHADGEKILKPLKLSPGEVSDLVAFLQSLSEAPAQ